MEAEKLVMVAGAVDQERSVTEYCKMIFCEIVTILDWSGGDNFTSCPLAYNCVGNYPELIQLSKLQTCSHHQ